MPSCLDYYILSYLVDIQSFDWLIDLTSYRVVFSCVSFLERMMCHHAQTITYCHT